MGVQEFPSKPVNKGGVIVGTVNGPTEIAVGAQDGYLAVDSTQTPGVKWKTYAKYNTVQLTSGTTWTVPATVEMIDFLLIGGGCGGTGCSTAATLNSTAQENGGSGGAVLFKRNYSVTPGASITYSIGSGGAGGANPAPTASTTNYGGSGGNTTFDGIVAPGGGSIYGTQTTFTGTASSKNSQRGIYNFSSLSASFGSVTATSNNQYDLAKIPLDWNTIWWAGNLASATSAVASYWPGPFTFNSSTANNQPRYNGVTNTFDKIVSAFTPTTGSAASVNELTANTSMSGWGGFGGNSTITSAPYIAPIAYHGGGSGGSINNAVTGSTRSANGGAAAANSGAGGGGACVITGAATVAGAAGGAGGSGVIFIGYWA